MNRRTFLINSASAGAAIASASIAPQLLAAAGNLKGTASKPNPLVPPAGDKIMVAVAISEGVNLMDFCGPWEVFQDTMAKDEMPFHLFTVSKKTEPVTTVGNLRVIPAYSFADCPRPQVIIVPAQKGSDDLLQWLRATSAQTDVTMSVCTGAFKLAAAGLLDGKSATTHHEYVDKLERQFPKVKVVRSVRFVENDKVSTAAGLSSGIDLALRVVERYFGREVAQRTAHYLEYQTQGWIV